MNVPAVAMTALVSCVVACHCGAPTGEAPAAGPEVSEATPPPTPPPANPTYDGYDGPLVASGPAGVFLLDPRGAIQAKISDKPGHSPRWLRPGETLLVLRSTEASGGERTLALVEIDVTAGTERVLVDDLIGDTMPGEAVVELPGELVR